MGGTLANVYVSVREQIFAEDDGHRDDQRIYQNCQDSSQAGLESVFSTEVESDFASYKVYFFKEFFHVVILFKVVVSFFCYYFQILVVG